MPANPFYIQPAGNFGAELTGLAGVVGEIGERKKAEEKEQAEITRIDEMKRGALDIMENGTEDDMRKFVVANPEMAQTIKTATEIKFPGSGDRIGDAYFAASIDSTKAPEVFSLMQEQANADGVITPEESAKMDEFQTLLRDDPEKAQDFIKKGLYIFGSKDQVKRYQDMTKSVDAKTPSTAMGQYIKQNPNATPEQLIDFTQKLKAGGTATTGKTYSKKNPDGSTRTIKNVKPGSEQETQLTGSGFVEGSQTVGAKMTARERADKKTMDNVDKLTAMANKDPNAFYENENYRMNDDGSLYLDPVTDMPVKMKSFYDATGKRGVPKAIMELGEQWDDAKELIELLELPSVQASLKKAKNDGLWDKVAGKWNNKIQKWMQDQGIKGDSPTATAIARTQRMASDERKRFMGTAVTENEQISSLAWMPSAGDSYESMINKTTLMAQESEQMFRRYIDVFGKDADMSPFYKAFGIKRFGAEQEGKEDQQKSDPLGIR